MDMEENVETRSEQEEKGETIAEIVSSVNRDIYYRLLAIGADERGDTRLPLEQIGGDIL